MSPEAAGGHEKRVTAEDISWARHGFINDVYPKLFGATYDSDSAVEITSLNVTSLLMQYEQALVDAGVIDMGGKHEQT